MHTGGAGGCLPLFVVPNRGAPHMLPYLRWLDYCQVSVLVTEEAATENMPGVLRALQALPPDEIAAKRRALRDVRDAFVLRGNSSPARPTAAEYILDEACHAAKDYAAGRVHQGARLLSSCFLEVQ